jgi:gluconolactonase
VIEVLVDGLDHRVGVCWDPYAGVVWAGGEAGQVYRVQLEERRFEEVARAPGSVLGLALDGPRPSSLLPRRRLPLRVRGRVGQDGAERPGVAELPRVRPRRDALRLRLRIVGGERGRVLRLPPDGGLDIFSTALSDLPNGCAVTADGRYVWIVESHGRPSAVSTSAPASSRR